MLKKYVPDPSHYLEAPPVDLREDLKFEFQLVMIFYRQVKTLQ